MRGWGLVIGLLAAVTLLGLALNAAPPGIIVIVTLGATGYGAYRFNLRKKAATENVEAQALGFEGADADPFGLAGLPLELLSRGTQPWVDHVLWGSWRAGDAKLFDFRYTSQEDGDRRYTCALIALDRDVPPVVIEPKTYFTPHAERGRLSVVEIEDQAFNEAFDVRAKDPGFTSRLLDADTRQWVDGLNDIAFEMNGRMLLAYMPQERRDPFALLEAGAEMERRLPAVSA